MRGLTLWQPMAWAIAEGHKPVENRPWPLPRAMLGQRFAVHAGKKYDAKWAAMIREQFGLDVPAKDDIALGAIVAVATFAGCVDAADVELWDEEAAAAHDMDPKTVDGVYGWFSGPYGFLLRGVQKLPTPIPVRGMQGLWTVPAPIQEQIAHQLQTPFSAPAPPSSAPPRQLTLVDPVAAERERIAGIIRSRAQRWRTNNSAASNLVATALDHVLEEIEP